MVVILDAHVEEERTVYASRAPKHDAKHFTGLRRSNLILYNVKFTRMDFQKVVECVLLVSGQNARAERVVKHFGSILLEYSVLHITWMRKFYTILHRSCHGV